MADIRAQAESAKHLIGATFEKNGRRFVVRRVLVEFDDADNGTTYVSRYADGIEEFSDWINEVTDG